MELPIFELTIDSIDSRIEAIALVDFPAIGRNYQTFRDVEQDSKQAYHFQIADEEKRVVFGPLMIPNVPIYRIDPESRQEYYALFKANTVEKAVMMLMKEGRQAQFNEMHDPDKPTKSVFAYQVFIASEAMGIKHPKGYENLADGTAYLAAKIEDDDEWQKAKDGTFRGFSIEGIFDTIPFEASTNPAEEFAQAFTKFLTQITES